jgi:hypothetical protein
VVLVSPLTATAGTVPVVVATGTEGAFVIADAFALVVVAVIVRTVVGPNG